MERKKFVKGWKCFKEDMSCNGFKFKVGKTYKVKGDLVMCKNGFHFHENAAHLFNYYGSDSRVCEIEAHEVLTDSDKSVCRKIKVVKELGMFQIGSLVGYGDGNGYGGGNGNGDGYGDGNGDGYGFGDGYGHGDGYGNGDGYGFGDGYGHGPYRFSFFLGFINKELAA